jgi:hypothetical protein
VPEAWPQPSGQGAWSPPATAGTDRPARPGLGWVLLAPALVALVVSYVWPAAMTIQAAATHRLDTTLFRQALEEVGYALSYAPLPLLILFTAAPALAWLASRAGRPARLAVRAALALPLVALAPTAMAVLWRERHRPDQPEDQLAPAFAQWDARLVLVTTLGAFVAAVGVTCYLAAMGRAGSGRRTRSPVLAVGALLGIVTLGFAAQQYVFVHVVQNNPFNGTDNFESTPMVGIVARGSASNALFALTLLAVLAVLGIGAALVVLRFRLRLEVGADAAPADGPVPARPALAVAAVLLGAALLVLFLVPAWPWLSTLLADPLQAPPRFPGRVVLFATWTVPLLSSLAQVAVAALAGFAIGAIRPLGRRSELLLLVFAPWLLVSNALAAMPWVDPGEPPGRRVLEYALPPTWVSIPALFLFAVLFRGQAMRWRRMRASDPRRPFLRTVVVPVVPMVSVCVVLVWLLQAQDLALPTMVDANSGRVANGQWLLGDGPLTDLHGVPASYPLAVLAVLTVVVLALQLWYLDRVSVHTGEADS